MRLTLLFCCLALFSGCKYHFQGTDPSYEKKNPITINIPYIKGDKEGELNSALILALAETDCFEYQQHNASLELQVEVLSDDGSVIGYRYDRDPNTGKLRPNILSTESRRTLTVSVKLIDLKQGVTLVEPVKVSAAADFDYVETSSIKDLTFTPPGGSPQTVINFSLGQLDAIDGANDDVRRPIYQELAQKIVASLMARPK